MMPGTQFLTPTVAQLLRSAAPFKQLPKEDES